MTDAANLDQVLLTRGEGNSKAFLDMEDQVHDLHRFTAIAYDYVIKLFHELDEVRREALRPEMDKHLTPEDEENITFLLEQIAKAAAKLPEFYSRDIEA